MTNNNGNFNYLDTLPSTTPQPIQSYQPQAQQYQTSIMTPFTMGANGIMKNGSELEKSIFRFETDTRYQFNTMKNFLLMSLEKHYIKYFIYLETIKQRRGQEEYLIDLKKILNKLNENISKSERTIIKLKKILDYSETSLPVAQQVIINGRPQGADTFSIPELQEQVEKDDNIDFVDVFVLKGKNISHILDDDRLLIITVIQSLMDFPPTAKLYTCLKMLRGYIDNYPISSVSNNDKLPLSAIEQMPELRPLVEIDIYSKLFNIFDKGSLNIKNIKTDKIEDKIAELKSDPASSSPSSPSSPSSYSPYRNFFGGDGRPDYSSYGDSKKK